MLLSAGYAAWSLFALQNAGGIVRHTYDQSLMAINYARAAEANTVRLLTTSAIEADDLITTISSDLEVVIERSTG
ncbi:MAG: hypothetical protein AAGA69_08905, partial [Pseudomonadota bacterium]